MNKTLEELYQEMYELTHEHCGCDKSIPTRCCDPKYCEIARAFALKNYAIALEDTGHPSIPFMGSSGCVVDPHLRPICTLHACCISYQIQSSFINDPERTQRYYVLRDLILKQAVTENKAQFYV